MTEIPISLLLNELVFVNYQYEVPGNVFLFFILVLPWCSSSLLSPLRAALMSCLKVLKLLLVSQAFSFIISVSHEIKQNTAAINSDRHRQACQVQDAINTILPSVEQKLRSFATNIAKNLPPKVTGML